MNNLITLILIVHNRHKNLDRLLKYYDGFLSPLIIADSSEEKHLIKNTLPGLKHFYTPGLTFTQKIEYVLNYVETPYVTMCADDDFIIPDSLSRCVTFLANDKKYSVAQGTCLVYKKEKTYNNKIQFGLLYKSKRYDIEDSNPITRLEKMLDNYRSLLYAVHRTDIIKLSFKNTGRTIKNLFLNEYLTAFIPIVSGKYKELEILYQVREFSETSDDKISDNLNIIVNDNKYKLEYEAFLNLVSDQISKLLLVDKKMMKEKIELLLHNFSKSPLIGISQMPKNLKKRLGILIGNIPVLGRWMINKNRQMENYYALKQVIKTQEEREELNKIEILLKNYS